MNRYVFTFTMSEIMQTPQLHSLTQYYHKLLCVILYNMFYVPYTNSIPYQYYSLHSHSYFCIATSLFLPILHLIDQLSSQLTILMQRSNLTLPSTHTIKLKLFITTIQTFSYKKIGIELEHTYIPRRNPTKIVHTKLVTKNIVAANIDHINKGVPLIVNQPYMWPSCLNLPHMKPPLSLRKTSQKPIMLQHFKSLWPHCFLFKMTRRQLVLVTDTCAPKPFTHLVR